MKKILVIALVVVMAVSVLAFAACTKPVTVTGECKYESKWAAGSFYGAKVDVTVKGDVVTAVKLYTDEETGWTRTTASWDGFAETEAKYEQWINDTFVGKTVAEINAYVASATQDAQTVGTAAINMVGATQSAARIICAVQNALSKLPA